MKSNELRKLIREEVKSFLKENITQQSTPDEIKEYITGTVLPQLQKRIEDAAKKVTLKVVTKNMGTTKYGEIGDGVPETTVQLQRIGFKDVKELMFLYNGIIRVTNTYFSRLTGNWSQQAQDNMFESLMNFLKKAGF